MPPSTAGQRPAATGQCQVAPASVCSDDYNFPVAAFSSAGGFGMIRQLQLSGRVATQESGSRMITKQQYRKLMNEYQATGNVTESAMKAGM